MSVLFLVPLTISAIAAYIYFHWADEGAHILGLAAALGLITAIIMAPWELQAMLLTLGLLAASYLLRQRQSPFPTSVSTTPISPPASEQDAPSSAAPLSAAHSSAAHSSAATEAASFTYRGIPYAEHGTAQKATHGAIATSQGIDHPGIDHPGIDHPGIDHPGAHRQGIYRGLTWHARSGEDAAPSAADPHPTHTAEIRYRGLPVRRK